jgi:hypothetical protein
MAQGRILAYFIIIIAAVVATVAVNFPSGQTAIINFVI